MSLFMWMMALDWKTISACLAALIAIPTLLTVLHTRVFIPIRNFTKHIWVCFSKAESYMKVLDTIASEFQPNGGNSIRDVLNRLENHMVITDTKIQAIMNYHGIPAWEADAGGNLLWASNEFLELLELPADRAQGMGWIISVQEEDRERVRREWLAAVADARDFYMTFKVGQEDSTTVVGRGYFIKTLTGKLKGYIGTLEVVK